MSATLKRMLRLWPNHPIWLGDSSLPPHPGKGCSWLQDQVPLREVQESALQPARPLLLFVLFLIGIFFWDEEDQVLYPAACCKGDQSRQGVPGVPVSFLPPTRASTMGPWHTQLPSVQTVYSGTNVGGWSKPQGRPWSTHTLNVLVSNPSGSAREFRASCVSVWL